MEASVKIIYFITIISAMIHVIALMAWSFFDIQCINLSTTFSNTLSIIYFIAYITVIVCVVLILWLRLHFSFKESMFEITQCQQLFFIICLTIGCIDGIMVTIVRIIDSNIILIMIAFFIALVIYLALSIYGMILFSQKMYALTKMRASSHTYYELNDNCNGSGFNQEQKELLYTTTKYVSLLSLAIISTWITFITGLIGVGIEGATDAVPSPMGSIDGVINIFCLYLQFPVAKGYYDKYCTCLSQCFTYLFMKHATRQIRKANENEHENEDAELGTSQTIATPSNLNCQDEAKKVNALYVQRSHSPADNANDDGKDLLSDDINGVMVMNESVPKNDERYDGDGDNDIIETEQQK